MQRDRSWLGPLAGLMIVALLVRRLGAGAFVDALRHLDAWSVAAGAAIAVLTTVCGAWRWVLVARGLGAQLSLRSAVAESYRSQFLNVTLPGGMLVTCIEECGTVAAAETSGSGCARSCGSAPRVRWSSPS